MVIFLFPQETLPELMNTDASDRVAPRFDRKKVNVSSQSELVFLIKNEWCESKFLEASG